MATTPNEHRYRGRFIMPIVGRGWLECGYRWYVPSPKVLDEDNSPHFRTLDSAREFIDGQISATRVDVHE